MPSDFDTLTQKVSTLVDQYGLIRKKNEELENKLAEFEKERQETKQNIEKIINKIEELEIG